MMLIERANVELRCPVCNQKRHLGYPCQMSLLAFQEKLESHLCSMCRVGLTLVRASFETNDSKFWGRVV